MKPQAGDFLVGAATGAIVSLANHWLHGSLIKSSGIKDIFENGEEILDHLMKLKPGEQVAGKEISQYNKALSKASMAIKSLVRTKTGFKANLTWLGRNAIRLTGITINDGSLFTVNKIKHNSNNIYHITSPANSTNRIYFGQDLVKINMYIDKNRWSIHKDFRTYMSLWK